MADHVLTLEEGCELAVYDYSKKDGTVEVVVKLTAPDNGQELVVSRVENLGRGQLEVTISGVYK